ncbi:hypothetical protein EDB86DRAFT_2929601 [Lactarius hatsudake]|nr:hypothetical protein EDB86DRAFT_2929601 [Lactarius hatsudake]
MWPISLLQVADFGLLVYGTFLFNNLIQPPRFLRLSEGATLAADVGASITFVHRGRVRRRLTADLGTGGFDVVPTLRPALQLDYIIRSALSVGACLSNWISP